MVARIGETMLHSSKINRALPQWIARRGSSVITVRATDIEHARTRAAQIGMRNPESIALVSDPAADTRAAIRAFHAGLCRG